MTITTRDHTVNKAVPPEILEPYQRWKSGQLQPQEVHDMVDTHMEAFFAEFSDIAYDASRSDIAYTERKSMGGEVHIGARNRSPLVAVLSMSLLALMATGGWFAYKTDEGIHALHQQIALLNAKLLQQSVTAPPLPSSHARPAPKKKSMPDAPVVDKSPVSEAKPSQRRIAMHINKSHRSHRASAMISRGEAARVTEVSHLDATEPTTKQITSRHARKHWMVVISSYLDRKKAEREIADLRSANIDGQLSQALVHGKIWYRVILPGFTRRGALHYLNQHRQSALFTGAWVGKEDKSA